MTGINKTATGKSLKYTVGICITSHLPNPEGGQISTFFPPKKLSNLKKKKKLGHYLGGTT